MGNSDLIFIFIGKFGRWTIKIKGEEYKSQVGAMYQALKNFEIRCEDYLRNASYPEEVNFTIYEIIISELNELP